MYTCTGGPWRGYWWRAGTSSSTGSGWTSPFTIPDIRSVMWGPWRIASCGTVKTYKSRLPGRFVYDSFPPLVTILYLQKLLTVPLPVNKEERLTALNEVTVRRTGARNMANLDITLNGHPLYSTRV